MMEDILEVFQKYKKYILVCILIGIISIPLMDVFVLQRDRNRNLVYGSLFWEHGFQVYSFNDHYLRQELNISDENLLQENIVNVTYEYPPAVLLFFAGVAKTPLARGHQKLLVNLILFAVVNINFLLLLKIGEKYEKKNWFKIFAVLYYLADSILAINGGKMGPLTNLFVLLAIYHYKKEDWVKANILLAIAVQIKIYPIALLPFFMLKSRKKIIWFFLAVSPLMVFWLFESSIGDSFVRHVSNQTSYSSYYTNPLYVGHFLANPISIITFVIFLYFLFREIKNVEKKENLLLFLITLAFFFFGWVLPWYFVWLLPMAMIMDNENDLKRYVRTIGILCLLYVSGLFINLNYYQSTKMIDMFGEHFNSSSVMNRLNSSILNLSEKIKTMGLD